MKNPWRTVIFTLIACGLSLLFMSFARAHNLPNPKLTPGDRDRKVTQDNIHETICVHGYTSKVRNVPESLKKKVFSEYGITKNFGNYEVDHFISLDRKS